MSDRYVINLDQCLSCGMCESACPIGAVHQVDGHYEITGECMGCGACADTCPGGAIKER